MLSISSNKYGNSTTRQTSFKATVLKTKPLQKAIASASDGELEDFSKVLKRVVGAKNDSRVFSVDEHVLENHVASTDPLGYYEKIATLSISEVDGTRGYTVASESSADSIDYAKKVYNSAIRKITHIFDSLFPVDKGVQDRAVTVSQIEELLG